MLSSLVPEDATTWSAYAQTLVATKDYAVAESALVKALEIREYDVALDRLGLVAVLRLLEKVYLAQSQRQRATSLRSRYAAVLALPTMTRAGRGRRAAKPRAAGNRGLDRSNGLQQTIVDSPSAFLHQAKTLRANRRFTDAHLYANVLLVFWKGIRVAITSICCQHSTRSPTFTKSWDSRLRLSHA